MEWIYVGVILNSILTAGFPTEEACLGRKVVMERDNKIQGTCIRTPTNQSYTSIGGGGNTATICLVVDIHGNCVGR